MDEKAQAWKDLVRILPIILPSPKNKESVKANFENAKNECIQEGHQFLQLFTRLKNAASIMISEEKRRKFEKNSKLRQAYAMGFNQNVSSCSESSEEDEEEFIRGVKIADLEKEIEEDKPKTWEYHSFANDVSVHNDFEGFLDRLNHYLENEGENEENEDNHEFTFPSELNENSTHSSIFDETDSLEMLHSANITPHNEENQTSPSLLIKNTSKVCNRCGCSVSKQSTQYCKKCRIEVNREEKLANTPSEKLVARTCNSCNNPISNKSKGLCKTCHHNKSTRQSSSSPSIIHIPTENVQKPQRHFSEARPYRLGERHRGICARCSNERVIFANRMCQTCYKIYRKDNNIVLVKREHPEEKTMPGDFIQTPQEEMVPEQIKRGIKRSSMAEIEQSPITTTTMRHRKTNQCVDCKNPIYRESDRCKPCFWESKKKGKDQQNTSTDSSMSDRKSRNCLRCEKTISIYGKSGFCHQCYFDNRRDSSEFENEESDAKENLTPKANKRVKLENFDEAEVSDKNEENEESAESAESDESAEELEELEEANDKCVLCNGPVARRSKTGTCSTSCYKRMYNRQKKVAEQSASTSKSKAEKRVILDSSNNEEMEEESITEQSVNKFFDPPAPCKQCWSFEILNSRRLCKVCHEKEFKEANECAKPSNKTTLDVYLEKTERFLLDN